MQECTSSNFKNCQILYKFIFIFTGKDHDFLVQSVHLLQDTRFYCKRTIQLILRPSRYPELQSLLLSSLMVPDYLRIHGVLSTGQHCSHPGRVKSRKTEQTKMETILWSLTPPLLTKRSLCFCRGIASSLGSSSSKTWLPNKR